MPALSACVTTSAENETRMPLLERPSSALFQRYHDIVPLRSILVAVLLRVCLCRIIAYNGTLARLWAGALEDTQV